MVNKLNKCLKQPCNCKISPHLNIYQSISNMYHEFNKFTPTLGSRRPLMAPLSSLSAPSLTYHEPHISHGCPLRYHPSLHPLHTHIAVMPFHSPSRLVAGYDSAVEMACLHPWVFVMKIESLARSSIGYSDDSLFVGNRLLGN